MAHFPKPEAPDRPRMFIEEETEGDLGTRRMIVNFGPQHPVTHGTLRHRMELDGERGVTSISIMSSTATMKPTLLESGDM